MNVFKRGLLILLAITMTLILPITAFADEENEPVITYPVYNEFDQRLEIYNATPLDHGWLGDLGYFENKEQAGLNAKKVRYADSDIINNTDWIIHRIEMRRLMVDDYTLTFEIALIAPEKIKNEDAVVTALVPTVRLQGSDVVVYDHKNRWNCLDVKTLKAKMASAKKNGENFIKVSVPVWASDFNIDSKDKDSEIRIECCLATNQSATQSGYGNGSKVDEGVGVAFRSINLARGAVKKPDDKKPEKPNNTVVKPSKVNKPKATQIKSLKKGKKSFSAKWKKVKDASGYELKYSTNKRFKKSVGIKRVSAKKLSIKIKKLKSKRLYYVKLRVYKTVNGKRIYGDYSRVKRVKTK